MDLLDDPSSEARLVKRLPDPVSVAVGIERFVSNHRFRDLRLPTPYGDSPRLSVSRYYWDADPPVAVDFLRELRYGQREHEAKCRYFAEHDIHYVLVTDKWAGEEVESQIRVLVTPKDVEIEAEDFEPPSIPVKPLLTAPRRKRG